MRYARTLTTKKVRLLLKGTLISYRGCVQAWYVPFMPARCYKSTFLAPVVRKAISANLRLNNPNPRDNFILRLNSLPRSSISTIQGLN